MKALPNLILTVVLLSILPGTARFDVERLDLQVFQPLAELFTDKLWAIV